MNISHRQEGCFFSVIIPMYNREHLIGRALDSCLNQDFNDFEIIVVDDGSTDGSADAVQRYDDPRMTLVRHERNRGMCPARNTGVREARGQWIAFLDSDDELLPDALRLIHGRAVESGPEISRLVFMYRLDTGGVSPDPPLVDEIWDYARFLRWWETPRRTGDFFNIVRKSAFDHVRFPENRGFEGPFHLEFARIFRTRCCPDLVGIIHSDAVNRSLKVLNDRILADASDNAREIEAMLSIHGEALSRWAPRVFQSNLSGLATLQFLSGKRLKGLECAGRSLRRRPLSLQTWVVVVFGLLGPRPLAWVRAKRALR